MTRWSDPLLLSIGPCIAEGFYLLGALTPIPGAVWVYAYLFPAVIIMFWVIAFDMFRRDRRERRRVEKSQFDHARTQSEAKP